MHDETFVVESFGWLGPLPDMTELTVDVINKPLR